MSKRTRALRRTREKRIKYIVLIIAILILVFVLFGYYRSNQSMILKIEDYSKAESSNIFIIQDSEYFFLDDFSEEDLAFPLGTKVSGYDVLTITPKVINQEFLDNRLNSINDLINNKTYENWDQYSIELRNALSQNDIFNRDNLTSFINSNVFFSDTLEQLEERKKVYSSLNNGRSREISLKTFSVTETGYLLADVSEYNQIANEAVLSSLNENMINALSRLDTNNNTALRVVNSDHYYATAMLNNDSYIQGEEKVRELKAQYKENLSNYEYYKMLISRIDRLRLYPTINFEYRSKTYPAYLVDVISENDKKILVFMLKDYLSDLLTETKINTDINVLEFPAFIVPQSAIIRNEDKNYIQILQKGYFVNEVEVNVQTYDRGKAILKVEDNPNLKAGTTIKIYP